MRLFPCLGSHSAMEILLLWGVDHSLLYSLSAARLLLHSLPLPS